MRLHTSSSKICINQGFFCLIFPPLHYIFCRNASASPQNPQTIFPFYFHHTHTFWIKSARKPDADVFCTDIRVYEKADNSRKTNLIRKDVFEDRIPIMPCSCLFISLQRGSREPRPCSVSDADRKGCRPHLVCNFKGKRYFNDSIKVV